jgi:hypothetical protein
MAFIVAGIILLLFVLMIYGLVQQSRARAAMTEEDWENRERETSLLSASVMGFDKILRPDLEKAAAVEEDQRQGRFGEQPGLNVAMDLTEADSDAMLKSEQSENESEKKL